LTECQQPGIETKGIASFPSPVTTLNAYRPSSRPHPIKHDDFTDAVIHEFGRVYAGKNKPMQTIEIDEGRVKEAKVWDGVRELKSWEWTFGQTPEFSNDFEGDLSFGKVVSEPIERLHHCDSIIASKPNRFARTAVVLYILRTWNSR
jgi:lipoate-protein ligase A